MTPTVRHPESVHRLTARSRVDNERTGRPFLAGHVRAGISYPIGAAGATGRSARQRAVRSALSGGHQLPGGNVTAQRSAAVP